MDLVCWCGSGQPLQKCHQKETWYLPEVKDLILPLPPDITPQIKTNIINWLNRIGLYTVSDDGSSLKFSSSKYYINFFTQYLISSKEIQKSEVLNIPSGFKGCADPSKNLKANFISDNIRFLSKITNVTEINKFVSFKKCIGHIFFASQPKDLTSNVKFIANKFFQFYPNGSIDFISVDYNNFRLPVVIRNFAKQNILGIKLAKDLLNSSWNEKTPMESGGAYFDIMFNLMGGGTYGFASPWLDRTLLLTFGEWISFQNLSYAISYAKGSDIDFYESGINKGEQIFGVSQKDFRIYTAWFIKKLNRFLSYLSHFATFADRTTLQMNPVKQHKYFLTWEELIVIVIKIIGTEDLAVKKQLTFTFLDILAHLQGGGVIDHLFKKGFIEKMMSSFDDLPEPFRDNYKKHAAKIYDDLFDEVFNEVIPQYTSSDKIKLPSKEIDRNSFVGAYISALRNTIHGYPGSREYEEVIFINSGEVPIHLPEIIPVLFLYLLIKPNVFFKSNIFTNSF